MTKEKILQIKIKETNLPKEVFNYLKERREDPFQFGAINGYVQSLVDSNIQNPELREKISKAIVFYIQAHFWAGVYFAKNNPDKVTLSQEEIKEKKEGEIESYFG